MAMRWVSILICWLLVAGAGHSQETRVLGLSEVYQLAGLLRSELNLVAEKLGAEAEISSGLTLQDPGAWEQYAQALVLFRKSTRLLAEQCKKSAPEPSTLMVDPKMGDVYEVLRAAVEVVRTHLHQPKSPWAIWCKDLRDLRSIRRWR